MNYATLCWDFTPPESNGSEQSAQIHRPDVPSDATQQQSNEVDPRELQAMPGVQAISQHEATPHMPSSHLRTPADQKRIARADSIILDWLLSEAERRRAERDGKIGGAA